MQVHRFRDSVSLWAGNGETVYMTAATAKALAKALNKAARSVEREDFTKSEGLTATFTTTLAGGNRLARDSDGRAI